jgi:antitoxin (DNA-binding transcriptional repressor) of toxin-antitoxin stability system
MKTIGAKELRLHLDQVLDRVLGGEEIIISHRFKKPVKLSAVHTSSASNKSQKLQGLRAFDAAPKRDSPFDTSKSIKELYADSIAKKHGT